jgi:hypothetical protein
MPRHHGAGSRRERFAFDPPLDSDDGHGGVETDWDVANSVIRFCEVMHRRSSEGEEAARPSGRALYKLRLMLSSQTRAITADWRARDLLRGTEMNIRSVDALSDRAHVWIEAESGVAV